MVGVPIAPRSDRPGPNRATKTRRYKPEQPTPPLAPTNEIAYENPIGNRRFRDTYGDNPLTGALDTFSNTTSQIQSNVASGALQIPTDIAGMVDLVRVGAPAVVQSIPDDSTDDDFFTRVQKKFTDGILTPEAQQELADDMTAKVEEFIAQKPDATEQEVDSFLRAYQDTEEFFDTMTSKMSPGFRIAQMGNKWANEVAGLGKRPDQQTAVDELEQIIGQSVIGIPASVSRSIMSAARKRLGSAVVDNVASKVALRVAEVASPLTLPLTPGNVALNVGVGTGINEAMRIAGNQPSLINGGVAEWTQEQLEETPELASISPEDADTLPAEFIEPADGHGANVSGQIDEAVAVGGVTLGAFFGLPAFRRMATTQAANKAKRAIDQTGLNAGPTLADQSGSLDPMLSPMAGAADVQAPIRRGANMFELYPSYQGQVTKGQMIDAMDAQLSTASPPNVIDAVSNVVNHGTLSNAPDTIPLMTIRRAADTLAPPDRELLAKYGIAKQRQQDEVIKRQTMQEELRSLQMEYSAAAARGDTRAMNAARDKAQQTQQHLDNLKNDTVESRNLMQDWTKSEIDEIIMEVEKRPEIMAVAELQRKSGHDLLNYQVANKYITSEEATIQAMNRDFWFPVRERSHPGVENKLARKVLLFADRIKGRTKQDTDYHTTDAVRNLDERTGGKVNQPKEPIVALQEAWSDTVKAVTANNARRQVIDTLSMFKGAEGKMFRRFEYNGRKLFSAAEYYNPNSGLRNAVEGHRAGLTRIIRDGQFEFIEWSDDSMRTAMEFAPLSTIPIVNATRKAWQNFTTGVFAPWFAAKAMTWDIAVARTTMKNGRSLGLIDTYARRLANESKVANAVLDHVPDPTAVLSVAARIPYALTMRAARALGHKIADDLALNNGLFSMIAQVPGGRKFIDDAGTSMVKMFDRSVFNVYNRNLSTTMGLLQENTRILDDYNSHTGRINPLGESARNVWRGYKALVESVQGATRLAFFSENYARLEAKHGGKVPKGALAALVKDTRDLSGDMSKYSGNKVIQMATSAIPYSNPTIQGTRHIFGAMIPGDVGVGPLKFNAAKAINKVTGGKANLVEERSNRFWTQFTGGILLPAIATSQIMQQWPGADEYWQNKVPEWRQLTGIPIPTAAVVAEWLETGEWPEFSPDKLTVLEVPPELSMILNPVMAGLRALGLIENPMRSTPKSFTDELKGVFESVTNVATPPLVNLFGAMTGNRIDLSGGTIEPRNTLTFGGANADMRTFRSDLSQQVYDVIGALASSSGQMFAQTFDVFDMKMDETNDFGEAWDRASETFKAETARRFPDIPGLFNTPTKEYAFTPESQFVYDTERKLEPIIGSGRQQSVETDSKDRAESMAEQGLIPPAKITDPLLKEVSTLVYSAIRKKGPYKEAAEQYTNLRADLNALEASRATWSEEAYHAKYNEIVSNQQLLKSIQSHELQSLQTEIQDTVGPLFEQQYGVPFNFETLSELVRKDVSGP